MLVNLYSAKTPIAVLSLPLFVGLLGISIFLEAPAVSFYFWNWQHELTMLVRESEWLNYGLTVGVISLTAHQLNNVYNRHTFFSKATFLPGAIYPIALFSLNMVRFSPELIAHLFLVFALGQLLKLRRQEGAKSVMFWAGIFIGMAIVFSFFTVGFVILAFLALATFRPFVWREWLLLLLGVLLPLFYYMGLLYIIRGDFNFNIAEPAEPEPVLMDLFLFSTYGMLALVLIGAVIRHVSVMRTEINRFKKQSQVIFHTLWISAGVWALGYYGFDHIYYSFTVPVSFIVGTAILHARKSTVANGIVIIWLIISAANVFVAR